MTIGLLRHIALAVAIAALLCAVATAAPAKKKKKPKPCAVTFEKCEPSGCAKDDAGKLFNQLKRTVPSSGTAIRLTLDDLESLQDLAASLVGEGKDLTPSERNKLRNLKVSTGAVSEGSLVEITGFLAANPRPNSSGESVNCRFTGGANNDFHIPIGRDPDDDEFEGIVAEMIPQKRPVEWTVPNLKKVRKARQLVLVRGQIGRAHV